MSSYPPGVPVKPPFSRRLLYKVLRLFYQAIRPTFVFQGKTCGYFWSDYNLTARSERCVEIPIAREALRAAGPRVLEVGNVLSHYFPVRHDILDKYESGPGVINADIADFHPHHPYDTVLSVSTFEHIGWDEAPRDPERVLQAFDNLQTRVLKPGGKAVLTFPLGHNAFLDGLLAQGRLPFTTVTFMKRLSKFNHWVETGWDGVKDVPYGQPYPLGNALVVGLLDNQR